jgi:hypothetical protein
MKCLHPHCPMRHGVATWEEVVNDQNVQARARDHPGLLANLIVLGAPASPSIRAAPPTANLALLSRLLQACPCLFNQIDTRCTPAGVIHLCEITLGDSIISANVAEAFDIQHPRLPRFLFEPTQLCTDGGGVMEALCSEVLHNEGVPKMELDDDGWPIWQMPGHILLNTGKMISVKAFGDVLIPAAPSNVIISVKSQAARERLLYSANMIEGVGFGFFDQPREFWTKSRMNLFKRMGFTAIYLPDPTWVNLMAHIRDEHLESFAVNINGKELYRPLSQFGADMRAIVGKTSLML